MIIRSILATAGAVLLLSSVTPAEAETGSSPVAPGGSYFSVFGGLFHTDIDSVRGHAAGTIITFSEKSVDVAGDGFAGIEFGHTLANPMHLFDRIETFFEFGGGGENVSDANVPFNIRGVTGVNRTSGLGITAVTKRDYDVYDFGVRLRNDSQNLGGHVLPVFIEPFIRFTDDDTSTRTISTSAASRFRSRDADVDAWFLGVLAGVDPEFRINESVTLVGSLAAGLYFVDADGKFSSSSAPDFPEFNQSLSDGEDTIGFRGRAQGAVKFALTQSALVSLFAGVDYWSDVPVAFMPDNIPRFSTPQPAAHVDMEDVVEVKAGARLTIALDALGIGN